MPATVGLCPGAHTEEFYLPDAQADHVCPSCDEVLTIYAAADHGRRQYREVMHSVQISDTYLDAGQLAQLREAAEPYTLSLDPGNHAWTCDTQDAASAERLCDLLRGWEISHTQTVARTWQP
jgi:hypothetical protein